MNDPEVTDVIAELDRRVRTDDLTQLGSKAQMVEWLETAASGSKLALLDLDDFRLLNQTLGHDAGDVLLTLVARRLERACPEPDYRVGRISQDEFAVLQVGADADAEQLASVVASTFRDPFRVGGRAVGVRATCGITECAPTKSPTTVIREADTAMYEAKARAKSGALVFDEVYHRRAVEAFELADGLGRAVAGSEFDIHYQPEVDLARGRVVGAEALLRWTNPRLGAVPPDTFIPIAETCGMIGELGAFVLRGALAQRRRWIAEGVVDDDFTMAVNVSARQIDSDGFGDLVAWQLEVTGCPPERLCLELTESAIMADPAEAVTRLGRLARLGVQLAIDDFGTGYSSLAYLQHLPITHLKIDRSFVARSAEPRGAALIEATIGIARALGLATVAEGIETPEQRRLVTDLGCDVGQGYLFARPMPPSDFAAGLLGAAVPSAR